MAVLRRQSRDIAGMTAGTPYTQTSPIANNWGDIQRTTLVKKAAEWLTGHPFWYGHPSCRDGFQPTHTSDRLDYCEDGPPLRVSPVWFSGIDTSTLYGNVYGEEQAQQLVISHGRVTVRGASLITVLNGLQQAQQYALPAIIPNTQLPRGIYG